MAGALIEMLNQRAGKPERRIWESKIGKTGCSFLIRNGLQNLSTMGRANMNAK